MLTLRKLKNVSNIIEISERPGALSDTPGDDENFTSLKRLHAQKYIVEVRARQARKFSTKTEAESKTAQAQNRVSPYPARVFFAKSLSETRGLCAHGLSPLFPPARLCKAQGFAPLDFASFSVAGNAAP